MGETYRQTADRVLGMLQRADDLAAQVILDVLQQLADMKLQ